MKIQNCTSLDEVRLHIDEIDQQIIQKISERSAYVNQAAQFKHNASEVEAPKRVEAVIEKVRGLAMQEGLDPAIAEKVYRSMITAFIEQEKKHLEANS